jgi:hypothetical protein
MAAGTLREGAYNGGSRMAAPWPDQSQPLPERPEPDQPEPDQPEPDQPEPDQPDEDEDQGEPDEGRAAPRVPAGVQDGAGWVLGLLVWGLIVMPFMKGGPARVKQTLMAKFLNKAADGSRLP